MIGNPRQHDASRLWWITLFVSLTLPHAVYAHARLVKSMPADNATLSQAPAQIELTFNEQPEAAFSRIKIIGPAQQAVLQGQPVLGVDAKSLIFALPAALAPGDYKVRARVLSVDGHVIKVRFSFHIAPAQ